MNSAPASASVDYLVYEVDDRFAEFFNDHERSAVGAYLDSTATDEEGITPPLVDGRDYCLVPHDFSMPDADDKLGCATSGDDGPVRRYIDMKLMACPEGFWFTHGVEFYSAKLMTAVIPWSVLEGVVSTSS